MAKRFTDTTKWDDDWYLQLSPKLKCAWDYICDKCDGSGVLKFSAQLMSFQIGESVTRNELDQSFGNRILWLSDSKLWVVGFITFQYKTLSLKNHAHRGIMEKIISITDGLPLNDPQMTLIRQWKEGLKTLKDIGNRNKVIGNSSTNTEDVVSKISAASVFENRFKLDFENLFSIYPNNSKKTPSISLMAKKISDQSTYDLVKRAISNYAAFCRDEGTSYQYIMHFTSFWNEWRDWIEPKSRPKKKLNLSGINFTGPEGAA